MKRFSFVTLDPSTSMAYGTDVSQSLSARISNNGKIDWQFFGPLTTKFNINSFNRKIYELSWKKKKLKLTIVRYFWNGKEIDLENISIR